MTDLPRLTTPRLLLRGVTLADAPSYQRNFAHWDIIRHLNASVPWPYPDDGAESYLRHILPQQGKTEYLWAICERADPAETLIGGIFLHPLPDQPGTASRGFWLGQEHQGKGYMTEAVTALQDHVFGAMGLDRLQITNAVENRASSRIKQKTGARLLRTEPGEFNDTTLTRREVWEITAADWASFRNS